MPCMGRRGARASCHIQRHPMAWNGRRAPSNYVRERRCNALGYVYLIAAKGTGSVKIGFSSKLPDNRLRSLQTANPIDLQLLCFVHGTRRDELRYHAKFDHLRVRGEWFKDGPEIREYFGELAS